MSGTWAIFETYPRQFPNSFEILPTTVYPGTYTIGPVVPLSNTVLHGSDDLEWSQILQSGVIKVPTFEAAPLPEPAEKTRVTQPAPGRRAMRLSGDIEEDL